MIYGCTSSPSCLSPLSAALKQQKKKRNDLQRNEKCCKKQDGSFFLVFSRLLVALSRSDSEEVESSRTPAESQQSDE